MTAGTPRTPEPPSTGVVVTGAIAVGVVVLFLASVVFGARSTEAQGDRVALVKSDEAKSASGYDVLVGRCEDERVRAIEVRGREGAPLWRIESAKGSFERRFTVGAPAFGFEERVPFTGLGDGRVEVRVAVGDVVDEEIVDLRDVDSSASVGAACGSSSVGAVGWVLALGGVMVVSGYVAMLLRYGRERRRRR